MRRLVILALFVVVSCAPDSSGATPVSVTLADDAVTLVPATVPAGSVTFETENVSDDLVHEIEVFAGAVEGTSLTVANAVADVTGLTLIDEVEDVVPGGSASLTLDLEAGTYLIICNLPEHYGNGMSAFLTVTDG